MPIINCKECEGKVSDLAESCPHCGAPVDKNVQKEKVVFVSQEKKRSPLRKLLIWLFVIIMILVATLFSYDFYMENSGLKNKMDYKLQKLEIRDELNNGPIDQIEDWNEERLDKKEERKRKRKKRREEIKEKLGL